MTAPRRLAVPYGDAYARQALDRAQVQARLDAERTRSQIGLATGWRGVLRGHEGKVFHRGTGEVLARVWAFREARMLSRLERAYELVLARCAGDGRAES